MKSPVLTIEAVAGASDARLHRVVLRRPGQAELGAEFRLDLTISGQEHEDLRWYLEEYAQYPQDPAPQIARRVAAWMAELGAGLFEQVFASDAGQVVWRAVQPDLGETRVEVNAGTDAVAWLEMRAPGASAPVSLAARSFVVGNSGPAEENGTATSAVGEETVRVLVVICRPRLGDDVAFRSVAAQLFKGLEGWSARVQLDVLRPPTFEHLRETLAAAAARGEPYKVVHFDGHGVFDDPFGTGKPRGYLLFENPDAPDNSQHVHGELLGEALGAGGVPVLLLNACRSARAESQTQPAQPDEARGTTRDRTKAYGSLAEEVVKAGIPGVVAMGFNVYVVTAAQFMANLYHGLASGLSLGEAVTDGRRKLFADRRRAIVQVPVELDDWVTPVVYESAPIAVCSAREASSDVASPSPRSWRLAPTQVAQPETSFFGMDDVLLSIDRAFDRGSAVLLHGYAGCGKTSAAIEFANWYLSTGGVGDRGAVLFTSFEQHADLTNILDRAIEPLYGEDFKIEGRSWLTLTPGERRQAVLDLFAKIPVLWIWDNLEPVAGFPDRSDSPWSDSERAELLSFLQDAAGTQARFLLTSRRAEQEWLGPLVARVPVSPLPMLERLQMALELARSHGRPDLDIATWRPLIAFTEGNPLTLLVVVKQALSQRLDASPAAAERFVEQIVTGAVGLGDDAGQGRSASLGASLRYGFERAFNEDERGYLALLYLFRGVIGDQMLALMFHPEAPFSISDMTPLSPRAAGDLLQRAALIGLLSPAAGGWYRIHPALPWFFSRLYQQYHGPESASLSPAHGRACLLAYCSAVGLFGQEAHSHYNRGDRDWMGLIALQEPNLLQVRRSALEQVERSDPSEDLRPWYAVIFGSMDALRVLLEDSGRWAQWGQLVEELVPYFIDPTSGQALPDKDRYASAINSYRHRIAFQRREWPEAERIQRQAIAEARAHVADLRGIPRESLTRDQQDRLANLSVALQKLGNTLLECQDAGCVPLFEEALAILEYIGQEKGLGAECALNLGTAYKNLPPVQDLQAAEHWYVRSLELRDERDRMGAGETFAQIGNLFVNRFERAISQSEPDPQELNAASQNAVQAYQRALALLPEQAWTARGAAHMGLAFLASQNYELSMRHHREALRCFENDGDHLRAGMLRSTIALKLWVMAKRPKDALEFARASVRSLERVGTAEARAEADKARKLIADIEAGRDE